MAQIEGPGNGEGKQKLRKYWNTGGDTLYPSVPVGSSMPGVDASSRHKSLLSHDHVVTSDANENITWAFQIAI